MVCMVSYVCAGVCLIRLAVTNPVTMSSLNLSTVFKKLFEGVQEDVEREEQGQYGETRPGRQRHWSLQVSSLPLSFIH